MSEHYDKALIAVDRDRYKIAIEYLNKTLEESPDDSDALGLLALCLVLTDREREAHEPARRAIELNPESSYLHYVNALVIFSDEHWVARKLHSVPGFKEQGEKARLSAAHSAVRVSIELDPYDADSHHLRAQILYHLSKYELALDVIQTTLTIDPDYADAHMLRSKILQLKGKTEGAAAAAELALEIEPEDDDAHDTRGWVYIQQNRIDEAIDHFTEALRIDPNNLIARVGLTCARKSKNRIYAGLLRFNMRVERFGDKSFWILGLCILPIFIIFDYFFEKIFPNLLWNYGSVIAFLAIVYSWYYLTPIRARLLEKEQKKDGLK